jgi:16S rRNA (guanine527-N7)-methyltransferase
VVATSAQIDLLCSYFGLLAKWNKTVNLTALDLDPLSDKSIDRLFVEPFMAAGFADLILHRPTSGEADGAPGATGAVGRAQGLTLVDIGSGGGSPAIPLKVALPDVRLRMVEAKARKSAFLREAIRQIPLPDADVLNTRMEELLARPEFHESADLVSVRAVRADQRLWNTLSAFCKPGALVLWFKSHADRNRQEAFFPAFQLEAVEPLVPAEGSEVAILRKLE